MDINLDYENTRRHMIAKRVAAGANTPIGHCVMHLASGDWKPISRDQYAKAWARMRAKITGLVSRS